MIGIVLLSQDCAWERIGVLVLVMQQKVECMRMQTWQALKYKIDVVTGCVSAAIVSTCTRIIVMLWSG